MRSRIYYTYAHEIKRVVYVEGSIPEEFIDRVRRHFDILDVVQEHIQLKKSGGRYYFGLCPFHSEKTPSFSVSPDKQIFHCFGCGEGGNVVSFIMKLEGMTFPEAIKYLAEKAGFSLPQTEDVSPAQIKENEEKARMVEAHEFTVKLYHHILWHTQQGQEGLEYLKQRGFTTEAVHEFSLGFAPLTWDTLTKHLRKRSFAPETMEKAGLIAKSNRGSGREPRYFDRFRGRIMFPIQDNQGRVIGFGGRSFDGSHPKYLNTPETKLFQKGRHLFNLSRAKFQIRKKRLAVLMEGYADVIAAWQAGVTHVVATLGTALTAYQARLIRRNTEQVIICYDSDDAGREAASKTGEVLDENGCFVKVALMPKGMDPDDYIRSHGSQAFEENVLAQSMTFVAFKLDYLKRSYNLNDEGERMQYIQAALQEVSALKNAVERDHYLRQLSEEFNLSLDALKMEQRRIFYKMKKYGENRDKLTNKWNNRKNNGQGSVAHPLLPAHHNAERTLLALMMRDRSVAEQVEQTVGPNFNVDEYSALSAYLYTYYAEGNEPDPGRFTQQLQEETLMGLASELAMIPIHEDVNEQELSDYIKQVRNYPKKRDYKRLKEEIKKQEKAGNHLEARRKGQELIRLRKELEEDM